MVFIRINSNRIYLYLLLTWRKKKVFLYLGQINSEDYVNIRFKSILDQLFFFNLNWAPLWIPFYCSITQSHLDSATPWTEACQASLSFTISRSLIKLMSTESVTPSNLCLPLFLLPSIFASIRVFFQMSWLFISGGQSIGASTWTSVLPMNIQGWSPLGLTSLISLMSKGLSRIFSSTTLWKHQFFSIRPSLWSHCHNHTWLLEKL